MEKCLFLQIFFGYTKQYEAHPIKKLWYQIRHATLFWKDKKKIIYIIYIYIYVCVCKCVSIYQKWFRWTYDLLIKKKISEKCNACKDWCRWRMYLPIFVFYFKKVIFISEQDFSWRRQKDRWIFVCLPKKVLWAWIILNK